jgi:mono/diheme cytochrome c family protein
VTSLPAKALFVALAFWPASAEPAPDGALLYLTECASCHGIDGRGQGPDANLFLPGPSNLREGTLEGRETADLLPSILDGARRPIALDPKVLRKRLADTESIVEHLEAIPMLNARLVEHGEEVYVDRCELCHGPFGRPPSARGTSASPPDLSAPAFQRGIDDDQLVQAVRHGRPGMPAIPALSDAADARALVAFLRMLSPGFELYRRHCASCHGDDGHPAREFVEPRHRPTVVFDRAWHARRDPTQLRAAVSHMLEERQPGMPHFRRSLSDAEARAILRHLRGAQ